MPRSVLLLLTTAYLALLGWMTLGPQPLDSGGRGALESIIEYLSGFEALAWITYDVVEFLANIALFVPAGVLFVLLLGRGRWWLALCLAIALSGAIEALQLLLPERVPDLRDLAANSLGAVIGLVVAVVALRAASRRTTDRTRPVQPVP
jgi:glycopeptide antibiotics resistance protein